MVSRIIYKQNYIKQYKTELFQAVCCRMMDNLLFLSTIHFIRKMMLYHSILMLMTNILRKHYRTFHEKINRKKIQSINRNDSTHGITVIILFFFIIYLLFYYPWTSFVYAWASIRNSTSSQRPSVLFLFLFNASSLKIISVDRIIVFVVVRDFFWLSHFIKINVFRLHRFPVYGDSPLSKPMTVEFILRQKIKLITADSFRTRQTFVFTFRPCMSVSLFKCRGAVKASEGACDCTSYF